MPAPISSPWQARDQRLLLQLNLVLIAALWLFAVWAYGRLPQVMPVHFNLAGQPDGWAHKGIIEWFLLPVIITMTTTGVLALAWSLPRIPLRYWNMPRKRELAALAPELRVPIIRSTMALCFVLAALTTILGLTICAAMLDAASTQNANGGLVPTVVVTALLLAVIVGWTVHLYRLADRILRRPAGGAKPR